MTTYMLYYLDGLDMKQWYFQAHGLPAAEVLAPYYCTKYGFTFVDIVEA